MTRNAGHVRLSDMGLATKLRKDQSLRHVAGTAGYWAPEVVSRSVRADTCALRSRVCPASNFAARHRQDTHFCSDIWSWGVMFFEMITGQRPKGKRRDGEWSPFSSDTNSEKMAQAVSVPPCHIPHSRAGRARGRGAPSASVWTIPRTK